MEPRNKASQDARGGESEVGLAVDETDHISVEKLVQGRVRQAVRRHTRARRDDVGRTEAIRSEEMKSGTGRDEKPDGCEVVGEREGGRMDGRGA